MFSPYPNRPHFCTGSAFPTIARLYHGYSSQACPVPATHGRNPKAGLSRPNRYTAACSPIHIRSLPHPDKSSNACLYTSAGHSFLPTPYPAMQGNHHAGCNPRIRHDKTRHVPMYAIPTDYHFRLSMSRIHVRPVRSYHYKPRRSYTTYPLRGTR